jgi:hypothetical protein
MSDAPKFEMFVRSVNGHAVARPGTREYLGATRRVLTKEQIASGESPFEWDDRVIPLTAEFCRRYARELREWLSNGELVKVSRAEWDAQANVAAPAAKESKRDC